MEIREAGEWVPVTRAGCRGVEARALHRGPALLAVMLRFETDATIDPHAAPHNIDVVCLEGSGHVSVGEESAEFGAGQSVLWPGGTVHCLWTNGSSMTTLMLEHVGPGSGL